MPNYRADQIRTVTLVACVRYGWLSTTERVFAQGVPVRGVYGVARRAGMSPRELARWIA